MRVITVLTIGLCLASDVMAAPPATMKQRVTDVYHGVSVPDDYRWLEESSHESVRAWSDAQNAYARQYLDGRPQVAAIRKRVTEIMSAETISYFELAHRRGVVLAMKRQPPKQQPLLVVISSLTDAGRERVLLDPNVLDPTGATSIDWHESSPDGHVIAVSLSHGGTETGDVHFFETATGKEVYEVLQGVNSGTAGGDLAWAADGSGVYYTRHIPVDEQQPSSHLRQLGYFHRLGTPADEDRYELGRDFLPIAEIEFEVDVRSGRVLASVQKGDGGEFTHYLRTADGVWTQFTQFSDQIVQATFGPQQDLLLISRAGAPRGKILRLPIERPDLATAETLIPEGTDTIVSAFYRSPPTLVVTASRLLVLYQLGGPSALKVFDHQGRPQPGPQQLPVSSVGGLTVLDDDAVLFNNTSFVQPPAFFRFDARSGITQKTWLATNAPVSFDDVSVTRELATSKDGTQVPLTLLRPARSPRDGSNPALVTGYGGYGHSTSPAFNPLLRVWLDQGFVVVVANLRGGGEFGERWHRDGHLTRKQNVFDDFAAVLRHVCERGDTSPGRLAIQGGSNGGLLMGATLVQHPELVKAVVAHVGMYDMLRVELSPNGVFNIPEFGTVKDPEQFRALRAYSPYHHVQDGTRYPATLFLTGANDPRVDPMQSRKMTARLQAATAADAPILLRTSSNSGHGADTPHSEKIEQHVDVLAFVLDQLQIPFSAPK